MFPASLFALKKGPFRDEATTPENYFLGSATSLPQKSANSAARDFASILSGGWHEAAARSGLGAKVKSHESLKSCRNQSWLPLDSRFLKHEVSEDRYAEEIEFCRLPRGHKHRTNIRRAFE